MRTSLCWILVLSALGSVPQAHAHAILVHSVPADEAVLKSPPRQALLRFDGRIEKKLAQIDLLDSSGRKIPVPASSDGHAAGAPDSLEIPLPALAPGAYRLRYRVLAVDGHATPGMIRFSIESPGRP